MADLLMKDNQAVHRRSLLNRLGLGRPALRAWALYDWANSAHVTVITATVLPPFFSTYYAAHFEKAHATAVYALFTSLSLLIAAALSPILGTLADILSAKKKSLAIATVAGTLSTALLSTLTEGQWVLSGLLLMFSSIAFGLAMVFYEGLLPHIAESEEFDRASSAGYGLGYVGGGLLLAVNAAWIIRPEAFGFSDQVAATKLAFLSVAAWWLIFSVPLFLRVPEPRRTGSAPAASLLPNLISALRRLRATFREIRTYRDLFVFLLAFWCYNDGIGTIIKMATIYGAELGVSLEDLVLALLITQFVAFPFAFAFGWLAGWIGARNGLYLALTAYTCIAVLGYFMQQAWHFYVLAVLVGMVQGGAQALSRSLFARMVPRRMSGEFFGFFSVSSKFATVFGPMLFAFLTHVTGTSRLSVLSLVLFFVGGMVILSRVDVARGEAQARAVDARAGANETGLPG